MEHRLIDHPPVAQMLDDDPLEQRRRHFLVPHAFRVHDDDRTSRTHAEAGRFAAFDPLRSEQQAFPLQQGRQQAIQFEATLIG